MKQYINYDAQIYLDGLWIPKTPSNSDYARFLQEFENGDAILIQPMPLLPTWDEIKTKRDQLIRETDYRILPDANPETKDLWIAYREVLRNITETFSTPESVIWPVPPEI